MTTVPTWPTTLPRPERNGFSRVPQDARQRRQNEAGPPSYRKKFSSVADTVTLSVLLTRWQKSTFDTFYRTTLDFGTRAFYMPDPTTDGWRSYDATGTPILDEDGNPVLLSATWTCLWGDPPTETVSGIEFRKSFSVIVMP